MLYFFRQLAGGRQRPGRPVSVAAATLTSALLLVNGGCGGGMHASSAPAGVVTTRGVTISVAWPVAARPLGRALPESTNSIVLSVTDSGGFTESRTINRGTGATSNSALVTFFGLASGTLNIVAKAYSGPDGTGDVVDTTTSAATVAPGSSASITLAFDDVAFAAIVITPAANATLTKGQTLALTAIGQDANGHTVQSNPSGQWVSSNPTAASVTATGVVTANVPGVAVVTFTAPASGAAPARSASVSVTVTGLTSVTLSPTGTQTLLVGAGIALQAQGTDATGATVASPAGTWASSSAGVASVDSSGHVTALTPGTATVTFTDTAYGQTAGVTVSVVAIPIVTIAFSPAGDKTLYQGQTYTVVVSGLDGNGKPIQAPPAGAWVSSNPGVATVDANGKITAVNLGKATITFTDSTFLKSAALTITVLGGDSQVTIQ